MYKLLVLQLIKNLYAITSASRQKSAPNFKRPWPVSLTGVFKEYQSTKSSKTLYTHVPKTLPSPVSAAFTLFLVVEVARDWTAPSPTLPTYLFVLIPALNFLLLFTFVRFASWPVVSAVIIALLGLFIEFFAIYKFLWYLSWITIFLVLTVAFLEGLYRNYVGLREHRPGRPMLVRYGDGYLLSISDKWKANIPAAKRLASRRMPDAIFSTLLIAGWVLYLLTF